ncbi:MAG: hypothetical protein PWP24_264 [Clostridiales bacterium]|nr:hypothetical protein [Clostridiales bacterium]
MKTCIACGMPMKTQEDYAMGDESKEYCKFCARPDGSMQSYDEKLAGMTAFIQKTQGFEETAAKNAAIGMMKKLPAWANH